MSRIGLLDDGVVYPTSDDQPMAESGIHRRCMIDVADTLELWFKRHGRDDVCVGSNNFLYYERGNPRAVVAPDVYVVVGAPAGLRDTNVHAVERAEGAGLRAGGDLEEHAGATTSDASVTSMRRSG